MFTNSCAGGRFVYKSSARGGRRPGTLRPLFAEGKHGGMWDSSRRRAEQRAQSVALVVSLAWMLLAQVACVLCWEAGLLTRQASLLHWLVVGVIPPALAMWGMEEERTRG
jgi:hypothetical protein